MATPPITASPRASAVLPDLDETLRKLLERELSDMAPVAVTFEAPTRDASGRWPSPALNAFLYDLREADNGLDRGWHRTETGAGTGIERAPLRLECSYAITAWTSTARDEHRLLSRVLAALLAHPALPPDILEPGLIVGEPAVPLTTRVAQPRGDGRADFWAAIGTPYKVAVELVVTALCPPGLRVASGPPVSAARVRLGEGAVHHQGGAVVDADGEPVADAWVLAPQIGRSAVTGDDGRFVMSGAPAGSYRFVARAPDGASAEVTAAVPGPAVRIELGR